MLDDAAVSYHLVLTKGDKVKAVGARRDLRSDHGRSAPSIPPRTRASSRPRAKPVAGSPSCEPRSSKPRRPRETQLVQADHRQSRLFELVDARLARVQAIGRGVRGAGRADVRRRLGQAARRRRVRARRSARCRSCGTARCVVWDSLAIIEFLADRYGDALYWPEDEGARGRRAIDVGRDALGLRQPAPRAADERPQELPAERAERRGARARSTASSSCGRRRARASAAPAISCSATGARRT